MPLFAKPRSVRPGVLAVAAALLVLWPIPASGQQAPPPDVPPPPPVPAQVVPPAPVPPPAAQGFRGRRAARQARRRGRRAGQQRGPSAPTPTQRLVPPDPMPLPPSPTPPTDR